MSDRGWQPHRSQYDLKLHQIHAQVLHYTTLVLGRKSLNHAPQQQHSDQRTTMHIQIYYPTVLRVLYEAWTMSDRGGQPHKPQNDIQLHARYAQVYYGALCFASKPAIFDSLVWFILHGEYISFIQQFTGKIYYFKGRFYVIQPIVASALAVCQCLLVNFWKHTCFRQNTHDLWRNWRKKWP